MFLFHREIPLHREFLTEHQGWFSPAEVFTASTCWWKRILFVILVPHVWSHCGFPQNVPANIWSLRENPGKNMHEISHFLNLFYIQWTPKKMAEALRRPLRVFFLIVSHSVLVWTRYFPLLQEKKEKKRLCGRLRNICGCFHCVFLCVIILFTLLWNAHCKITLMHGIMNARCTLSVHNTVLQKSSSHPHWVNQHPVFPVGVAKIRKPRRWVAAGSEPCDPAESPPGCSGGSSGGRGWRHSHRWHLLESGSMSCFW